jgi:hypothetical protein
MKKSLIAPLLGLVMLCGSASVASAATWQYLVVIQAGEGFTGKNLKLPDKVKSVPDMLNHYGQEGWELVAVTAGNETRFFFKRPEK